MTILSALKSSSNKKNSPSNKKPNPKTKSTAKPSGQSLQTKAREIILEAKDEAIQIKDQAEKQAQQKLSQLKQQQQQLDQKNQELTSKQNNLQKTQQEIDSLTKSLKVQKNLLKTKREELIKKLEKASSLTSTEAQKILLDQIKKKNLSSVAKAIKEAEEKAKVEADDISKEILVEAMRAGATDYVAEYTVSTIKISDEETKSRVIGKEGRNIRAFEKASGVDLVMDETPGEIKLSSFNSVRREIAKVALTRLIKDGRIQPTRIEEYLAKAKQDVEKVIFQEGKQLCQKVNVYTLPRDIIATLGKFKFRTSYGQNMIAHTLEVVQIGTKLAHELKANVDVVKIGCLLHDIGKVLEGEGSHVALGIKFLKKYNLPQPIINAVAQHHEDEPFSSTESILVYIADAISGARSGARRDNIEEYVNRINELERVAKDHPEVQEAYAIQAGREVRIIVYPDKITDDQLPVLAANIRDQIQNDLTYPGTVKVNVIREVRASETAN